jgi:hypothetical protein
VVNTGDSIKEDFENMTKDSDLKDIESVVFNKKTNEDISR